jgi:hypothetical protein
MNVSHRPDFHTSSCADPRDFRPLEKSWNITQIWHWSRTYNYENEWVNSMLDVSFDMRRTIHSTLARSRAKLRLSCRPTHSLVQISSASMPCKSAELNGGGVLFSSKSRNYQRMQSRPHTFWSFRMAPSSANLYNAFLRTDTLAKTIPSSTTNIC